MTTIDGHSCGRFREDEQAKFARAKRDLLRYTHYHNRFKAHKDSLKLESKLRKETLDKISVLEERETSFMDYSWIVEALNRLSRSRQIIANSYAFAYYMFGEDDLLKSGLTKREREIKQNLFEDQQQQLEANIERLSLVLEGRFHEFSVEKITDLRLSTINASKVVDDLCRKL